MRRSAGGARRSLYLPAPKGQEEKGLPGVFFPAIAGGGPAPEWGPRHRRFCCASEAAAYGWNPSGAELQNHVSIDTAAACASASSGKLRATLVGRAPRSQALRTRLPRTRSW